MFRDAKAKSSRYETKDPRPKLMNSKIEPYIFLTDSLPKVYTAT